MDGTSANDDFGVVNADKNNNSVMQSLDISEITKIS